MPRSSRRLPLRCAILILVAGVISCDDGPQAPPTGGSHSVTITALRTTIEVGDTLHLAAETRDAKGNSVATSSYQWSSSKSDVASVDGSGRVSALAVGVADIEARSSGVASSVRIHVVAQMAASLVAEPSAITGLPGDTMRLFVVVLSASGDTLPGRSVSWSSGDTTISHVDPGGLAVLVSAGATSLFAHADTVSVAIPVVVTPPAPVALLRIQPDSAQATVGETISFSAAVLDSTMAPLSGRPIAWEVSDSAVAIVSGSGVATALAAGATWVHASSEGVSDSVPFTVVPQFQVTGRMLDGGSSHSCGLARTGEAFCWGYYGYLGAGTIDLTPAQGAHRVLGGHRFVEISVLGARTRALTADGRMFAWGFFQHTAGYVTAPVEVPTDLRFVRVADSCAIATDGLAYCWLPTDHPFSPASFRPVPDDHRFVDISAGVDRWVALKADGTAWTWGKGMLGNGELEEQSDVPVRITTSARFIRVSVADFLTVALAEDGTPYVWGRSPDGFGTHWLRPTPIPTSHRFVEAATADGVNAAFLTSDGRIYSWGASGGAEGERVDSPVLISGTERYQAIASGRQHFLAIANDGLLHAWGRNDTYRALGYSWPEDWYSRMHVPTFVDHTRIIVGAERMYNVSIAAGDSLEYKAWVIRLPGPFTVYGPVQAGTLYFEVEDVPDFVNLRAEPSALSPWADTVAIHVRVDEDAPEGQAEVRWRLNSATSDYPGSPLYLNIAPPPPDPPPSGEGSFVCVTATTPLPEGYHCMEHQGVVTAGKFSDTELHGTWVDTTTEVCLTWQANGRGFARYKGGNQTSLGKWGAMINTDGSRFQNERYWSIFTETADPQTRLVSYDSQTRTIAGWGFVKGTCPF